MSKEDRPIHVMVDVETLGQGPTSPIVQIGGIARLPDGKTSTFERRIALTRDDWKSFTSDPTTIEWWLRQSDEARKAVFTDEGRVTLRGALSDFGSWITRVAPAPRIVWSHSTFDPPNIENAFRVVGLDCPVNRKEWLDLRTVKYLAGSPSSLDFEGIAHNAVDDCAHQFAELDLWLSILGMKLT